MLEELRCVISSPDFARAPIMKRLLTFLVGETAAGRGDQLKAYSVAVDGLGRAPDYDARADSYPRVQVGRLRRMLESYYAGTAPQSGMRLAIPSGRYRVALEPVEPLEPEAPPEPEPASAPLRLKTIGWQLALLLVMLLAATLLLLQLLPGRANGMASGREPPLLDLDAVEMAKRSDLGNMVRATLLNGLSRSSMFALRPLRRSGPLEDHPRPAQYRLTADLIGEQKPRLFLRLARSSPERLIWSGDIQLPSDRALDTQLEEILAPVIATIGRVNGVVATHELQEHVGTEAIGYGCLLLYHQYRRDRTDDQGKHVRTCLKRSILLEPDNAQLQAAAAQIAIETVVSAQTAPRDRPAMLLTARRHSQLSALIDPLDPWTNVARARVAIARKACPQAVAFAIRASQLQPYDPALLAETGIYLLDCGDARAEDLMRRAIALDDNPDGRFYGTLLLLAISRDDLGLAQQALAHMAPPVFGRHSHFYLVSAAGYAMGGDVAKARAAWGHLQANSPSIAGDPQGFLERLGFSEALRTKAIGHLRRAGLIA